MATYSFLNCQAGISGPGGSFSIGSDAGVADEGITIDPAGDKNTMTIGAGGDAMHSLHADKSGSITVRLLKTSKVNQQLMALYNLQTTNSALHGQNIITVSDPVRGDFTAGQQCAFKRRPANSYAKEAGMIEWVFDVGIIDVQLGSGAPVAA